jgi:two-component system, sensor histidine kinase and response regulator
MTGKSTPQSGWRERWSLSNLPPAVTAFAASSLLAAALLCLFLYQSYRATESKAAADALATATLLSTRLESTFNRVQATASLIDRQMATGDWPRPTVVDGMVQPNPSLTDLAGDFAELAGMAVYNANGRIWLSSQAAPETLSVEDRDYFRDAQAHPTRELRYGTPVLARISRRQVLPVYVSILDSRGTFRGLFVASISTAALETALQGVEFGEHGVASLRRTDDGRLIARYPLLISALNDKPSNTSFLDTLRSGGLAGTLRFVSPLDGVERIQSNRVVAGYPFYVGVGYATSVVFAQWWRLAIVFVVAFAIALTVIGLLLRRGLRQQRKRQEVQERYQALVEGVGDPICRILPDGTYAYVNAALRRYFERPGTHIVGGRYLDFIPENDRAAIRRDFERIVATGEMAVREVWHTCVDGVDRCFQWQSSTRRERDGKVVEVQVLGRDVTALKQATRDLAVSTERLELALQVGNIGWSDWNLATNIRRQSAQLSRMMGLEPCEMVLPIAEWQQYVAPEDRARYAAAVEKVRASDDVVSVEYQRLVAGVRRWFLTVGKTVERAADGSPQRMLAAHLDITEQKAAEARLQESEARLEMALDIGHHGWFEVDVPNLLVRESPGWLRGLGYAPRSQSVPADLWLECVHPEDREAIASRRAALPSTKNLSAIEYRRRAADGSWRAVQSVARVTASAPDGTPLRVIGMLTDITERRAQEQALRENEHQYRALADSGNAFIWTSDAAGHIDYANRTTLEFLGVRSAAALDTTWPSRMHEDDRERAVTNFTNANARREGFVAEYRARNARDELHWLRMEFQPRFDLSGEFLGFIGHGLDVTDARKDAEELERHRAHLEAMVEERTRELKHAKELAEAANVAKSSFLSNMSHELRTPLNAIAGMSYLVRQEPLTAKQRERLMNVDRASQHLLEIINAVLDLAKIDAGRLDLLQEALNVLAIAPAVVAMVQERADDKGLVLTLAQPEVVPRLLGDATRIREALLNYVANAIKFTAAGVVAVNVAIIDETEEEATIRFEVKDTGIGIDAIDLPRLFRSFEQLDGSATRRFGGTGLGLAITERLAKEMRGEVGVESALGQGSKFWFTARLRKDPSSASATEAPEREAADAVLAAYEGSRVLLVEDEPINRELGIALLEQVGLAVDCAVDGEEAVTKARRQRYAAILMDVHLPKLSGLEATARIRQLPTGKDVPIVAMTADAFDEDRRRCLAAGMDDFVSKPVDPDTLFRVLLRHLAGNRVHAEVDGPHSA